MMDRPCTVIDEMIDGFREVLKSRCWIRSLDYFSKVVKGCKPLITFFIQERHPVVFGLSEFVVGSCFFGGFVSLFWSTESKDGCLGEF